MKRVPEIENDFIRRAAIAMAYPVIIPCVFFLSAVVAIYSAARSTWPEFVGEIKDRFHYMTPAEEMRKGIIEAWMFSASKRRAIKKEKQESKL